MKKMAFMLAIMLILPLAMHASAGGDAIREMMSRVDENVLYRYDSTIQSFGPHPTGSEECEKVADFIYGELKSYGLDVENYSWEWKGYKGRNIVATIPGDDEMVILSAHYDSVPVSPGADDDGSGVSSLLMAAKVMSSHSFKHTVKFIFFSGEEQGLYGSNRFARDMYMKDKIILADLQLDGVGHAVTMEGGSKMRLSATASSTWIAGVVEKMAREYGDEIGLDVLLYRDFAGSDHQSFINYGYEGVFFLEYEFNPHYHSPQDTIENVNFTYMAKVCKLAIASAATLANTDMPMMVKIREPERGAIYFGERKILSLDDYQVVVIGKMKVTVEVHSDGGINMVEFYMDGILRGMDTSNPYEYTFGKIAIMKHHISVIARGENSTDMTEMDAYLFNLFPRYWLK